MGGDCYLSRLFEGSIKGVFLQFPFRSILVLCSLPLGVFAQGNHTLPASLAAPGAPVLIPKVGGNVFAEGVAADWQGNVYYNEMDANNRTMRLAAGADTCKPWRQAKDAPNGMWIDTQGRILICQVRAIVRVNPGAVFDNRTDTLYAYPAGTGAGQDFNDVTGDSKDNFFFTNFNGRSVFFRSADSGKTKVVLANQPKPNGIEWDEERRILYVCENEAGKVAAYDVAADFSLSNRRDFAAVAASDGIVLDQQGNVYVVSYGNGVHVYAPDRTSLGQIPIPGVQLTNLAFGGTDFKTMYIVGNKGLYKLPMAVKGYKTGNPPVSLRPLLRPGRTGLPALAGPTSAFRLDGRRGPGAASMGILPVR